MRSGEFKMAGSFLSEDLHWQGVCCITLYSASSSQLGPSAAVLELPEDLIYVQLGLESSWNAQKHVF